VEDHVVALFHGQTVNVSSIARDSGAARSTVNGYLDILEDTSSSIDFRRSSQSCLPNSRPTDSSSSDSTRTD